jgi:hypothetical protein
MICYFMNLDSAHQGLQVAHGGFVHVPCGDKVRHGGTIHSPDCGHLLGTSIG